MLKINEPIAVEYGTSSSKAKSQDPGGDAAVKAVRRDESKNSLVEGRVHSPDIQMSAEAKSPNFEIHMQAQGERNLASNLLEGEQYDISATATGLITMPTADANVKASHHDAELVVTALYPAVKDGETESPTAAKTWTEEDTSIVATNLLTVPATAADAPPSDNGSELIFAALYPAVNEDKTDTADTPQESTKKGLTVQLGSDMSTHNESTLAPTLFKDDSKDVSYAEVDLIVGSTVAGDESPIPHGSETTYTALYPTANESTADIAATSEAANAEDLAVAAPPASPSENSETLEGDNLLLRKTIGVTPSKIETAASSTEHIVAENILAEDRQDEKKLTDARLSKTAVEASFQFPNDKPQASFRDVTLPIDQALRSADQVPLAINHSLSAPLPSVPILSAPPLSSGLTAPTALNPASYTAVTQTIVQTLETKKGISVRLDPPEMGRVYIEFQFEADRSVTALVRADLPEALMQLKDNASTLQSLLKESGFDQVNLTFGENTSEGSEFGAEEFQHRSIFNENESLKAAHNEFAIDAPPTVRYRLSNTSLDIKL